MAKKTSKKKRKLFWESEIESARRKSTSKKKPASKVVKPAKVSKKKPPKKTITTKRGATVVEQKKQQKDVAEVKEKKPTTTEKPKVGIEALAARVEGTIKEFARKYVDELVKNMTIQGGGEITILQRSQPSVELKRSGKKEFSYTIKSYADTIEESLAKVAEINNRLVESLEENDEE